MEGLIQMRTTMLTAAACLLLLGGTSYAAITTTGTEVDLRPFSEMFFDYLENAVMVVIAVAVGWLAVQLNNLWGLNMKAEHRETLTSAAQTAAAKMLQELRAASQDVNMTVNTRHPLMAEGVRYMANEGAGKAVKALGATPEAMATKIEAEFSKLLTLEKGATGGGSNVAGGAV